MTILFHDSEVYEIYKSTYLRENYVTQVYVIDRTDSRDVKLIKKDIYVNKNTRTLTINDVYTLDEAKQKYPEEFI